MVDIEKVMEEFIQEISQPTDKDRISALESAVTDLAIMIMGVDENE